MKSKALLLIILLVLSYAIHAQRVTIKDNIDPSRFRIMFYNLENLFDTIDNKETNDEDFLPNGHRVWNTYKFYKKLNNIAKVIKAVGKWNAPDIVGVAEVENVNILNDLVNTPTLRKTGYRYIHHDSRDKRGIEVALLYKPSSFTPILYKAIPIEYKETYGKILRDILFVRGIAHQTDTISLFVNHWSSRLGGVLESESYRIFAAQCLRKFIDSLLIAQPNEKFLIMGDFNDYPNNKSLYQYLGAETDSSSYANASMINLAAKFKKHENIGTHKNNGVWGCLDQMIISKGMFLHQSTGSGCLDNFNIFAADFLLIDDEANTGKKPFRTYNGFTYQGGFSDHLPIYFDMIIKK